ncbi:MAG: CoA transferase [Chloroflexi bacterium]|nr:CoA transferase [Chloroflexota bacterium]
MAQPLAGVRVTDLSHALAGPFCTQQLQLLGADVIKVEPPGTGDDFRERPAVFAAINAGKRSIVLDLHTESGRDTFRQLVGTSDVLVENYRPGVTDKLGIDWPSLQAINPRLIYCSISGYGQTGPLRDYPAIEWAVQAMSGMAAGYIADDLDGAYLGQGVLDPFSGYIAFSAILAALLQRQQTGIGQRIDTAMLDAAMLLMSPRVAAHFLGEQKGSATERRPTMVRYRAKDRRIFIGALHRKWFARLCHIIDAPHLLDDPRFSNQRTQAEHADELIEAIEAKLVERPAAEWEVEFVNAGLPASVARSLEEVLKHPHLSARGILVEVDVPQLGRQATVVGAGFQFEHDQPRFQGPVPRLGQHTAEVLAELGRM